MLLILLLAWSLYSVTGGIEARESGKEAHERDIEARERGIEARERGKEAREITISKGIEEPHLNTSVINRKQRSIQPIYTLKELWLSCQVTLHLKMDMSNSQKYP